MKVERYGRRSTGTFRFLVRSVKKEEGERKECSRQREFAGER
jgi:hypothetical protein